ncbi:MAG: hypothetical protein JAY74_00150 [Candidatus Thiodiazotropha taylori]|nr:hypothetical protein [Candidatus Thiodiazotropha taylori]
MKIKDLELEMKECSKCEPIFRNRFVDPIKETQSLKVLPIFAGASSAPVMLIGQAPGISEYNSSKAFQGQAGGGIRNVFSSLGVPSHKFDSTVYQTSVTKCFPGRKKVKRKDRKTGETYFNEEDRIPNSSEINNCLPFLNGQITSIRPKIVVLLGKLAIDGYMRLRGRKYSGNLDQYVGTKDTWGDISIVFFPHTSGSSRWLNEQTNSELFKKAQTILKNELLSHEIIA